jgi:hypothetical protein
MNIVYKLAIALCLLCSTITVGQYRYDPNDFATEVVEYVPGTGLDADWLSGVLPNDPNRALGRPTLMTTGEGWNIPVNPPVPVVPVYQPFRYFEVVTVGLGGRLTLKFNHRVTHDKNNPYGIDFIIFGNAAQNISTGGFWKNGNPETTTVAASNMAENGIVSVSQDGIKWYKFIRGISADPTIVYADSNGPFADSFAPTASYQWDSVNHIWGEELDPTRPVNPALTAASMAGKTVAQMIDAYDGSAGGTGFDISSVGLDWIQYVCVEGSGSSTSKPEVDAVADVRAPGDFNRDCRVDMRDFAIAAKYADMASITLVVQNWLACGCGCE